MTWPTKPVVGSDVGVWGQKINAIFDALFAAEDADGNVMASIVRELADARGTYSSLALRLAAGGTGGIGGGTDGGTTTPTVIGTKNTYIGAGNTYATGFNQY